MAGYYEVRQGDTLAAIARDFGFSSYKTIYNHPENSRFKADRPDPDLIFPGDQLYIPDKEQRNEQKPTDSRHFFRVKKPVKVIRLALEDFDGKALAHTDYELWLGSDCYPGTTDGDGILEQPIAIGTAKAKIKACGVEWDLKVGDLNPIDNTPDDGATGIQMRLLNLGFDPGRIDGIIGPVTRGAIRAFQARHPPLKVDGICGPKTKARLIEEHGC